ncbi:hypothetical protein EVA_14360 [gut metagenome]|uniref:Uncharacterized protein n=1 Tax=gut metagenome TaxID=749906 RepID=J9GDV7_9ZZZZ
MRNTLSKSTFATACSNSFRYVVRSFSCTNGSLTASAYCRGAQREA